MRLKIGTESYVKLYFMRCIVPFVCLETDSVGFGKQNQKNNIYFFWQYSQNQTHTTYTKQHARSFSFRILVEQHQ